MTHTDYSYVGSGQVLIKEHGAAAPFLPIGNCSKLEFSPQVNTLQLQDFTNPGGGIRNRIDRVNDVQFTLTFHDFSAENFARFLRGTSTVTDLGTVAAEPVVGYVGGWTPLAKIAATITAVKPYGGGTPYTAGEDYLLEHGGLTIPLGSTIPLPEPGAPNIQVDYTFARHTVTEAFVHAAQQYTLVFTGMNEARSGKPVRVIAHKISGGVLSTLGLLGEDYGAGDVSGSLLADTTKEAGLSKFFQVVVVQ
ncbi:hypothetical protein [Xylella fastidiosa]|uniref:Uncharacterized protein n=1 Tax=Xylella fastidiosa subsp. fastidiosa TaxID=644356 RepID=A0AAJ5QZH6_XYLFS|nr:hypothetical protein [Xylella fastidiosa]KQH72942.1 hypothetical protein AOT81_11090 [Xylella fastidiosa]WCF27845.1 hypothetical protein OK117_09420 [Xylella fastidiosa subsp. fastidiosa]WNY18605.1 hypothetical protein RO839_08970 [Xylella fastidiosa]WNY20892.1 hypothetical protein RO838_08985 [Xylella fastidiosa]